MSNLQKYNRQRQVHGKLKIFKTIFFLMIQNSMMNSETNFLNTHYHLCSEKIKAMNIQLICDFDFAYAKSRLSHDAAQI